MGRKNTFGGNATKKKKRLIPKREYADALDTTDGVQQMFGQILAVKNGGHYSVLGTDNKTYLGRTNKHMKTRQNIPNGTFIVISLREYESTKKTCDIIAFANPPNNIQEQFKINNPIKYDNVIFCEDGEAYADESNQEGFVKMNHSTNMNFDDIHVEIEQEPLTNNRKHSFHVESSNDSGSDDDYRNHYEKMANIKMDKFGNYIEEVEEEIHIPSPKIAKTKKMDAIKRSEQVRKVNLVENQVNDDENDGEYNFDDI